MTKRTSQGRKKDPATGAQARRNADLHGSKTRPVKEIAIGGDDGRSPSSDRSLPESGSERRLTAEARRALDEAAARRAEAQALDRKNYESEVGGREGLDPIRYGDWEKDGIISDF